MNKSSEGRLAKVHPALAERIRRAATALSTQGVSIEVVQGLRTYAEQDALYAQGRTKPGKKVTNARGGQSNHNWGLAVDVCPFERGKANWDAPEATWEQIGAAGKAEGLEWGGDWVSIVDLPHLQIPGLTIAQCRALYAQGGLPKVWAAVLLDNAPQSLFKNGSVEPVVQDAPQQTVEAGGIGVSVSPATEPQREPISKPGDKPVEVTAVEPVKSNAKKSIWATIAAAVTWVGLNIQEFFGKAYGAIQDHPMAVVMLVCSSVVVLVIYWKYQERLTKGDERRSQQAHELTMEQMRLAADPDRYSVAVVKKPNGT